MNCSNNCEDTNFDMQVGTNEQTDGKCDPALTESSSSFDGDGTSFGEAEVDPELYDDALSGLPFSDLLPTRKKKLTSKWRRYIGPLMWRCKWVELQIKKFESQAQKYDREIAEYNGRKQSDNCISENVNSKSLPFSGKGLRNALMKRKKRRRVEDTEDTVSYMSHHNLFSYFENKKSATADAACTDGNLVCQGSGADKTFNGSSEIGFDEELQSCEFNDDESNFLEQIFWKIGTMQWKVGSMKTRAHKVLRENASRLSSSENLSLLVSSNKELTSSTENPVSSVNNKDKIAAQASPVSVEIVADDKDTKMVDLTMPKSAALRIGEANNVAEEDIKSINLPEIGGSSNPSSTILMYNRRAKMNQNNNEKKEANEGGSSSIAPSSQAPESSTVKIRSISKLMTTSTTASCNKRKRAMRKAGFGKWTH